MKTKISAKPSRSEIWFCRLDRKSVGHEQRNPRPCLIVSADAYNESGGNMAVVLFCTTRKRDNPLYVKLQPPEGGVREECYVRCDQVRTVSQLRLTRRLGVVSRHTMLEVEQCLALLLDLD